MQGKMDDLLLSDWLNNCLMTEGRDMWLFSDGILEMKKVEFLEIHENEGNVWKWLQQMHAKPLK